MAEYSVNRPLNRAPVHPGEMREVISTNAISYFADGVFFVGIVCREVIWSILPSGVRWRFPGRLR